MPIFSCTPLDLACRNNLGSILLQQGRFAEAKKHLQQVVAQSPAIEAPYLNLGSLHMWDNDLENAERYFRRAHKIAPNNLAALSELAHVVFLRGNSIQGEQYYLKVLNTDPRFQMALTGLAFLYVSNGERSKASEYFKSALESNPYCVEALVGLSSLVKDKDEQDALAGKMQQSLARPINLSERISLLYALGDYHDGKHDQAEAFCAYKAANELKKQTTIPYIHTAHCDQVSAIINVYDKKRILNSPYKGEPSLCPIFVVGMMRSGTSLVEQIIASHPKAFGAGELGFFDKAYSKQPELFTLKPSDIVSYRIELRKLREAYLKVLHKHSSAAERVVDKTTTNVMHLGLIHELFPNAKIICMNRNPIDTCLSIYVKNLANRSSFQTDLTELALYYKEHARLVNHWGQVLPETVFLEVPYEALVHAPEAWSKKLIEFLGLDWDPVVLEFYATKRAVNTASNLQVREKIHKGAIERWRPYKEFIKPLLAVQTSYKNKECGCCRKDKYAF